MSQEAKETQVQSTPGRPIFDDYTQRSEGPQNTVKVCCHVVLPSCCSTVEFARFCAVLDGDVMKDADSGAFRWSPLRSISRSSRSVC